MKSFLENTPKPKILTLNPPSSLDKDFFSKFRPLHFFYFIYPNFMQSFRKYQWVVSDIFKDGWRK